MEGELKKELTKPEDAADTLRLVVHDAGTYDLKDGTGGLNGSIRLRHATVPRLVSSTFQTT